jgi:hypothetical protein
MVSDNIGGRNDRDAEPQQQQRRVPAVTESDAGKQTHPFASPYESDREERIAQITKLRRRKRRRETGKYFVETLAAQTVRRCRPVAFSR